MQAGFDIYNACFPLPRPNFSPNYQQKGRLD